MARKRVLFLCTGNSCRSQMAEAVVNASLADEWEAFSAGVEPAEVINPHTVQALAEVGITHAGQPKHVDMFRDQPFDVVVTVCDHAAETCPVWLGSGVKVHLGFPDPATARGSEEEVMAVYRQVLSDISAKIPALLDKQADS